MTTLPGRLFLVPAPLDFGCVEQAPLENSLPAATLVAVARLGCWVCENAKSTRAYLKRVHALYPLTHSLQEQLIVELPREVHKKGDHTGTFDARPLLKPAVGGQDIGLVSEAGMPAIADPGMSVVRAAHDLGINVVPLVGPVSILLALAASGLNGQSFAFVGYLPQDPTLRAQRIRALESVALETGQTQLFIETPYRNDALLAALLQTLQESTRLAVSVGLTLPSARTTSTSVRAWRKNQPAARIELPAVFAIGC